MRIHTWLLLAALPTIAIAQGDSEPSEEPLWGHSRHGSAYDEGPRQRPWKMEGVGRVNFPITTSVPEVQEWFNQGIALLYGFWPYEAERAFRWCLKLDPECAMAYWGLARCGGGPGSGPSRSSEFLEGALERMDGITDRERAYIELEQALQDLNDAEDDEEDELREVAERHMSMLLMDYPDDIEARALYWLSARDLGEDPQRYAMEAVLDEILEADPDHVGALHFRIHTWDGEEGHYAIDSCRTLSAVAPDCGHLQHMPGHVLSGIGMWHEAAIAMDSATRVEKEYMNRRMVLPEDNWDYIHNLDYLGYIQEQLGMFDAALLSAKQLLQGPPMSNGGPFGGVGMGYSLSTMLRVLLKSERWDEVLDGDLLEWEGAPPFLSRALRPYAETRAHLGLGDLAAARESFENFEDALEGKRPSKRPGKGGPGGPPDGGSDDKADSSSLPTRFMEMIRKGDDVLRFELEGLLALAEGNSLTGIQSLIAAAELQEELWRNDPPNAPRFLYNVLGEELLELGSPAMAAEAFERTLETVFHDGFALAGLVRAYHGLGDDERAAQAMTALQVAWSDADAGNRWLEAALATGVEPFEGELPEHLRQPMHQRSYKEEVLDFIGPSLYLPTDAPALTALDAEGEERTLASLRGQNVLVIFYLGDECVHCIEQLQEAEERFEAFADLGTQILAISKDSLEEIAENQPDFQLTLLSDPEFENARRFGSFDDFEEVELHSTFLIDAEGRVHWSRIGGAPFMEFDYLEKEAARLHEGGILHELRGGDSVVLEASMPAATGGR